MAVMVSAQLRRMLAGIMTSRMAELKFPGEVPGTARPTVGSGDGLVVYDGGRCRTSVSKFEVR
jgi:hypothetical protein